MCSWDRAGLMQIGLWNLRFAAQHFQCTNTQRRMPRQVHISANVAIATLSKVIGLGRDSVRKRLRPCLLRNDKAPLLCDPFM
jgi:hypothetical protein